jgi:two-component system, OmpR family, sensor histidine kinase KdpD
MSTRVRPPSLRTVRAPLYVGALVAALAVLAATAAIYPLKHLAPVVSLSVVYLPAVLLVSAYWGLGLGLATSLASAAAFNYFHLPPVGRFTISDSRNWVALAAFVVVAAVVSTIAELARNRTIEGERQRTEADLAAALARELLAGAGTREALRPTAHRVAQALGLSSAAIELGAAADTARQTAIPLRGAGAGQLATLLVPRAIPPETSERLRTRVIPSLEALVAIALHRDAVQAEAVETAGLRRADTIKTAVLRAVSHDLRSPLTAIAAAGEALGSASLSADERTEMAAVVGEETHRLSRLVDNLLDLSRLETGSAEPRSEWTSVEDLLHSALSELGAAPEQFILSLDRDLPLVRLDAAQIERAFVNVLDNARRHSGGHPVSVRARAIPGLGQGTSAADTAGATADGSRGRLIVRVIDRGPGIPAAHLERVFEPFYRVVGRADGHRGSGLGLAIARGFTEANEGRLHVESLPGQGATFVFQFPLQAPDPLAAPADADDVATTAAVRRSAAPGALAGAGTRT